MRKILLLFGLLLAACSSGEMAASPKADTITCTAAYRADVTQPIEREESITFSDSDDEQSVAFTDMVFHAAYSTGKADNERALRLWVTNRMETPVLSEAEVAVYHSQLYQLPNDSGPQNQFVGGHGFTGLNYSYAPDSSAELQFWCEVG
ncbi:MAG: hypothetical protein IAF02_23670 [Anaerolineae bacterium]|nr:hypothetical protein [Anaerolineae bacterium]